MPDGDLSSVSTEDLLAYKSGDLSKVSTQGLLAIKASRSARPPASATPAAATVDEAPPMPPPPPEGTPEYDEYASRMLGDWSAFANTKHETTQGDIDAATGRDILPRLEDVTIPTPKNPIGRWATAPVRAAAQPWIDRDREQREAREYAAAHPNGPPAPDPNLPSASAPPLEPAPWSSTVAAGARSMLAPFALLSEPSAIYHEGEAERAAARRAKQLETGAYQSRSFPEKVQDFVGTAYGAANMEPAFNAYGEKVVPGAQSLGRALGGQTGENIAGAAAEVAPLVLAHALGGGVKLADAARERARFAVPIPEAGGPVGVEHGIGPRPEPQGAVVGAPDPRPLPPPDMRATRPAPADIAPQVDPFVASLGEPGVARYKPERVETVKAPGTEVLRTYVGKKASERAAGSVSRNERAGVIGTRVEPATGIAPAAGASVVREGIVEKAVKKPAEIALAPEPAPPERPSQTYTPPPPRPPEVVATFRGYRGAKGTTGVGAREMALQYIEEHPPGQFEDALVASPGPDIGTWEVRRPGTGGERPRIGKPREAPPEPRPSTQEQTRPETSPARETPPVEAETPFERKMREAAEAKPVAEAAPPAPPPEAPAAAEHPLADILRRESKDRRAEADEPGGTDSNRRQKLAVADAMDRIAAGEPVEKVGADLEASLPELVSPGTPEWGTEGSWARSQLEANLGEIASNTEALRAREPGQSRAAATEAPPERQPSPAPEGPSPKKEDVVTRGAEDITPQQAPEAGTAPVEGGAPETPPTRAKVGKPRVKVPVEEAAPRAKVGKPRKGKAVEPAQPESPPAATSKPPAEPREGPTAGAGLGSLQGVLTEKPVREYVPTDPVAKAAYERANLTTRWKPPKKPISERITDAYRALRRFGRTEAPLAEFERNQYGKNLPGGLEQEAQFAQRGAGSQLQALIDQGELLTERVSPRSIREDLTALRPDQERVLSLYLQAKNEARFRSQGKEYHLSQADAKAIIDDAAKNHPEVVRAAETIRDTFDFLAKKRVEAGILSQKSLDAMRAAGEYYGPVERVVGEQQGDGGTGGRGALNQAPLPRTKGSTRGVDDPVPGLFRALEGHIRAINEGFAGKALVEAYDVNPAKASPFMREIVGKNLSETLKRVGDRTDFKSFVADWEAKHGARDAANVQEFWDAYNAKNNERVVITHIDGKTRAFEFPRPDLYEAAMGLTHKFEAPIGTRTIFKIVRAMGSTFRTGTTVLSAAFNLGQLTRDPRVAFVLTSDPKMLPYEAPLRTALGYAKALRGDKSALTALYKQLGIDTMLTVDRHDAGAVIRDFTSKDPARAVGKALNPRKWLDLVREVGGRVEAGPREGEVGGVIERRGFKPGDKNIPRKVLVEASAAGNTVTAPFKLGSQASKVVSSFYPFFSAHLQANIATAQMALRRPATFAARAAVVSVIPRMILWAINKDEEWYKRMPSWKKYGLWHFSDDLQFPTINILDIPAITLEYALNRLNDEDPDAGSQIASQWLEELLPTGDVVTKPGQIVPQIAKPLVEHAAGRDFFTGNDINPPWKEGEKATRPDLVRRPETAPILSDVSKIIWENTGGSPANPQRGLHVTPEELKHAIGGYLGVIGKNFASASPAGATAEGADVPGIGRFTPRIRVSVHVENYYRKKKEREGAVQAFRDLATEGKSDEASQYAPSRSTKVGGILDKIDAAMTALRTKYDQAPTDAEKKSIAVDMDKLAKVGITVLDAVAPKESSK